MTTITLHLDEVYYDAASIMHIIADTLPADELHARHICEDILQGENAFRTRRYARLAIDDVSLLLHARADAVDNISNRHDDDTDTDTALGIVVDTPLQGRQTKLLRDCIHDAIVYYIVYQWLMLIGYDQASNYEQQFLSARQRMMQVADYQARIGRIKPYYGS